MISSLYNRENGVKPRHCVATANEPNTICPSASALGGDEFGCVPCTVSGGRSVNGGVGGGSLRLTKRNSTADLCKISP